MSDPSHDPPAAALPSGGGQTRPATLTPLDVARERLLAGLAPAPEQDAPLETALGCVAAFHPPLPAALPKSAVATRDGWAFRAADLAGASAYAPVLVDSGPVWVEPGQKLPEGADCVIDPAGVEAAGPLAQVLIEAFPGENIRRAGEDLSADWPSGLNGRVITAFDVMAARVSGLTGLRIRQPRVTILDAPARDGAQTTSRLIASLAQAMGAAVDTRTAAGRDRAAVREALERGNAELVLLIGGTGCGREDESIAALAQCDNGLIHGLALQPGRTSAVARIDGCPVIALPGSPDQALAVWWALCEPVLARLGGRRAQAPCSLPLRHKISSAIGLAEIVLLLHDGETFTPVATGDLPLQKLLAATHFFIIGADSEGHAPGEIVRAQAIQTSLPT